MKVVIVRCVCACVFSHINFVTQILNECSTDVVPTGMVRQTFARMLKLGV